MNALVQAVLTRQYAPYHWLHTDAAWRWLWKQRNALGLALAWCFFFCPVLFEFTAGPLFYVGYVAVGLVMGFLVQALNEAVDRGDRASFAHDRSFEDDVS